MLGATLARIAAHTVSWRAGLALRISGQRLIRVRNAWSARRCHSSSNPRQVGTGVHAASDSVVVAVAVPADADSMRYTR
jgi:hypothetical protein